jgi:L-lactate dehydrogenase complex protein LldG
MSRARDHILAAVRSGLGRGALDQAARRELARRLARPKANLVPSRVDLDHAGLTELFVDMALEAKATVSRVEAETQILAGLPRAVADYLGSRGLSFEVRMAPDPALEAVPWAEEPRLTIRRGRAEPEDKVSVTCAFAGIAETGTCMLLSGGTSPATLNLLVDTHIVVLFASRIVASYEDAWARLRERSGREGGDAVPVMPRAVTLITGPSRTADIEQTIQMGAHGPRRFHIVLAAQGPPGPGVEGRTAEARVHEDAE